MHASCIIGLHVFYKRKIQVIYNQKTDEKLVTVFIMRTFTVLRIAAVFMLCSYTNEAATHSKLHEKYWSLLGELGEAQYSSGVSSKNRIKNVLDQITPMRDYVRDWGSKADADQNTHRKNIICRLPPGQCKPKTGRRRNLLIKKWKSSQLD